MVSRDGTRWVIEITELAYHWARALARRMADPKSAKTFGKATFISGVERLAQSDRIFAVTPDVWDRDPWLLGTPGGTVDLRTGALHPPSRNDFISKQTSVAPAEPGTPCPLWHRFLEEITCGDRELARFLQQLFGYCLTGDARKECIFFS